MREGDIPAMQAMWLAVTVLTSMLSYKVCVHACSIPVVCVCVIVATMRQFVIVVIFTVGKHEHCHSYFVVLLTHAAEHIASNFHDIATV